MPTLDCTQLGYGPSNAAKTVLAGANFRFRRRGRGWRRGGLLGIHRGLRDVIDDETINVLFDQEAKLSLIVMSLKTQCRHFGDSDTLNNQINVGGDDGNRHCQAGPHRRSSASRGL